MDEDQFNKILAALNRVSAATLTAAVLATATRKPTLKELQTTFNDCCMITNPSPGTTLQEDFQKRIDKKEW